MYLCRKKCFMSNIQAGLKKICLAQGYSDNDLKKEYIRARTIPTTFMVQKVHSYGNLKKLQLTSFKKEYVQLHLWFKNCKHIAILRNLNKHQ